MGYLALEVVAYYLLQATKQCFYFRMKGLLTIPVQLPQYHVTRKVF